HTRFSRDWSSDVCSSDLRLDRQTYNAAQFQQTVGGTALDVVKNLPAISVDGQGQISLRGASGVLVLINDKPVVLDPVTFLSQIEIGRAPCRERVQISAAP